MTSNYPQNQPYSGYAPAQSNKTNGLAIASLSQIKRTGENGRGLAIAGLVIGYVSLAIGIIAAISMLGIAANQM
jgi:hypothetical protein